MKASAPSFSHPLLRQFFCFVFIHQCSLFLLFIQSMLFFSKPLKDALGAGKLYVLWLF